MSFLSLRIAPPSEPRPAAYNSRLDSLRGFAACSVMAVHSIGYTHDGDAWPMGSENSYIGHLHMSRAAVMLFFITSGYVIGLTHNQPFSQTGALDYLRKRSLRIVPLYLIALLLGWLLTPVNLGNLAANVFFLQNAAWGIDSLAGNLPVWSLHYEAVYYMAFLALWAFTPRLLPLLGVLLAFSTLDWFAGQPFSVPGGWASGGLFWLAGLLLAWRAANASPAPFLGWTLLIFASNHLWPGVVLLRGLGWPYAGEASIWLSEVALIPGCVVLFCAMAGLRFPGLRLLKGIAFLIPAGTCGLLLAMGRLMGSVPWRMAAGAFVLAVPLLLFERERWAEWFHRIFQPLGKISYGLYLLHVPIAGFVVLWYPWRDSGLNYWGGVLLWLALTLTAAWACERKLQPLITGYFRRRSMPSPAPAPDLTASRD